LQAGIFTWIEWSRKLGSKREVGIIKCHNKFAFLTQWVFEVDGGRFGSYWAFERTLWLRSSGFSVKEAGVVHSFSALQLQNTTAVSDRGRFVFDVA
jgi:hypothetical protein